MTRWLFTVINVLEFSDSKATSCFMPLQQVAVCPNRATLEFRSPKKGVREERKKEPPVLYFPIMLEVLGEFGGGVFDLRVPWEPQWGGSAAWLRCYMLALIKGKYASLCRTLLFICACNALLWCHADSSEMFWCRSFNTWNGAACSRAWRSSCHGH